MVENYSPQSGKSSIPEFATEITVLIVSLGLFLFIWLTDQVTNGGTAGFDRRVLLMFRTPGDPADPIGPAWLEVVVRDITALGGLAVLTIITLAACGYLLFQRRTRLALFILLSVSGGSLLNTLLKGFIERPRPDIVTHATAAGMSSFPSGHTMMAAIVFLTLGALLAHASESRAIKIYILGWSLLLAALVGLSRIYLGVHWPTDIIAGWIAGAVWALLCLLASRWFIDR
jgi:undecaprenyl-diphosphatase